MALHPFWLAALVVAIIVIVQLLKQFELVKEKVWLVPTSAVVGVVLILLIFFIARQELTIDVIVNGLITGVILGFASSGVYDLVTQIRGT